MRCAAVVRGSYVPVKPWKGTVLSVYGAVVNFLHPDGFLVSMVKDVARMSGYGLVVPDFFRSVSLGRLKGKDVFCRGGEILVGTEVVITFRTAPLWLGNVEACSKAPADLPLEHLFSVYRENAPAEGFSSLVLGDVHDTYGRAAVSVLEKAGNSETIDLSSLVGLGIGFTPSGDDFIAGALLFTALFGGGKRGKPVVGRTISAALHKTTSGGRTLLSLVLRNSFPFYLKEFSDTLCTESGEFDAQSIISHVLSHGSTSGSDALAGFFWISEFY